MAYVYVRTHMHTHTKVVVFVVYDQHLMYHIVKYIPIFFFYYHIISVRWHIKICAANLHHYYFIQPYEPSM